MNMCDPGFAFLYLLIANQERDRMAIPYLRSTLSEGKAGAELQGGMYI